MHARRLLLEELLERLPDDAKLGSGLMGVTETTFRRWVDGLGSHA